MKTALLFLPLLAFLPQDPTKTISLTTTEGETMTAQVLALDGDKAKLKVSILGGNMTVTQKLADFTPISVFRIEMAAKAPTDFDGHFAMAKRAAELHLLPQAGSEAKIAVGSIKDPEAQKAKRVEVRAWAVVALEKMFHEAIAEARLPDARHCLKLLSTRMSDLRTEEQLDALAGELEALEQNIVNARDAARQAKLDAKSRESVNKTLGSIREQLAKGDKLAREAVKKSGSTVQSTNLCEKAIEAYKVGWKKLQELIEKSGDDIAIAKESSSLSQKFQDNAIRAALHAANMLTVQSNYKGAMDWANRILAFDPDNAEAKEMVRTIQIAEAAASDTWGWGWSVVGGPAPDPKKN